MPKDFCMDCGMLLSPHTIFCSACGYDNNYDDFPDIASDVDQWVDLGDEFIPENYPGY